ncbi:phosphatase PAP2 family protein [Micrococcus porci]|uniref:phosphatase PAP2 family protein n=1 Tax=Micrococcus porci TaxID=2856555 RepID=UPI001CCFE917|nr:phosphatase PAP2 family protein [Micrococcus porci]UBH25040.1 phosphatase PAP2 family protein [Micrococcus porci]
MATALLPPNSPSHPLRRAPGGRPALAPVRIVAAFLAAVLVVGGGLALIPVTADLPVTRAFNDWNTGAVGVLSNALYQALEPAFAVVLALAVASLVALRRGDLALGVRLGLAVALAWLPVGAVKLLVHRPRPAAAALPHPTAVPAVDWTFPSGHVAFVAAMAFMLVLASRTSGQRAARAVLGVVAVAVMVATVLVLGVHYPTDVLASLAWVLLAGPLMWQLAGLVAGPLRRLTDRRGAHRA